MRMSEIKLEYRLTMELSGVELQGLDPSLTMISTLISGFGRNFGMTTNVWIIIGCS